MTKIPTFIFCCLIALTANAQEYPKVFLKKGFVLNGSGQKCWYTQKYEETNPHFMPEKMKRTTHHDLRTITFSDPKCMADSLEVVPDLNKMMNNRLISSWFLGTYVLKDADFDTEKTYPPGDYQARGECIQSKTYPTKSIAVEYLRREKSITGVLHMLNIGGCGKPEQTN